MRRRNCKGEYIHRSDQDRLYPIAIPRHTPRVPYPWESESHFPRITKEFFRCKGSPLNPPLLENLQSEPFYGKDCEGGMHHGLPILEGRQNVYPILVELLNYLQKKLGKRVIITCGHRCPAHNAYADPSGGNRTSKHQIGAEVDFYVQGMEEHPQEIVGLLMQYYRETPVYQGKGGYTEFQHEVPKPGEEGVSWMNQEVLIRMFRKGEGRDFDNRHPYPYLSLQVRYDRHRKERVLYSWEKAYRGYPHA